MRYIKCRTWCRKITLLVFSAIVFPIPSVFAQATGPTAFQQKDLFIHQAKGSSEAIISLFSDAEDNPVLYTAHLVTAVCSDGVCKPIDIHIYWDLLGRFYQYRTGKEPLTKFDHIPFTEDDHKKLNEILADKSSVFRDYEVEDMIDSTIQVQSDKVDGVTGATNKTFSDASVEGALYTVYILWHFIHGDIRAKIYGHTQSLLSESLITYMLRSDKEDYHHFIFDKLSDAQRQKFAPYIIAHLASKNIYAPHFALQQLTDDILADPAYQEAVLCYFGSVSPFVQNSLLARFEKVPISSAGIMLLLDSVPQLRPDQLGKVFLIIEKNIESIDIIGMETLKNLSLLTDKDLSKYAEQIINQFPGLH